MEAARGMHRLYIQGEPCSGRMGCIYKASLRKGAFAPRLLVLLTHFSIKRVACRVIVAHRSARHILVPEIERDMVEVVDDHLVSPVCASPLLYRLIRGSMQARNSSIICLDVAIIIHSVCCAKLSRWLAFIV